jgi:hypothetical protein
MKLRGTLADVADLSPADRDAMFALMDRHYRNVQRAAFERDLAEKRWVILLFAPGDDALRGFSTQMVLDADVAGRSVKALFSGDTIIDRDYWGDQELMRIGGTLALSVVDEFPGHEVYWFLVSGGYKTYRFLPVFFQEFYPRHDRATPPPMQQVVDALAGWKFPGRYDRARGIIRVDANQYCVRQGLADLTDQRLRDPHVEYFAQRNPGHVAGEELCCLARLSRDNFTPAAYRVLGVKPARK